MMKKQFISFLAAGMCMAVLLSGCGETTYSNEYVKLGQYKGITYTPADTTVTDKEIEQQLQSLLASKATTEQVTDRTDVQSGDTVNIDYAGTMDGVAFAGGTAQGYDLVIGSGSFIPGFEDQLIGAKVGETVTINVTFPDPYKNNPDMSGKEAEFTVTIHSISKTTYPELTDELVQEFTNSTSNTVEEYKDSIRQQLSTYRQQQAEYEKQTTIWQKVMDNAEVKKYPDGEIEQYVDDATNYYTEAASNAEMDYDEFLQSYYGMELEEFNSRMMTDAQEVVKQQLVVTAIAEAEKIEISDEEYQAGLASYAQNYQASSPAEFEKQYGKEVVENSLLTEKIMNFVMENAVEEKASSSSEAESSDSK